MVTSSRDTDTPPTSLQIKQHEKVFSRKLVSKESSNMTNSSFRFLYYGGSSGAIPFLWESRPGTPKHTFSDTSLPPLTPPPSYQFNSSKGKKKSSKGNLLYTIFPRLAQKKTHVSPLSHSPSFSSSCSSRSRWPLYEIYDDEHASESPTFCFGGKRGKSADKGCFRWRT